jgi:hypothetical protein
VRQHDKSQRAPCEPQAVNTADLASARRSTPDPNRGARRRLTASRHRLAQVRRPRNGCPPGSLTITARSESATVPRSHGVAAKPPWHDPRIRSTAFYRGPTAVLVGRIGRKWPVDWRVPRALAKGFDRARSSAANWPQKHMDAHYVWARVLNGSSFLLS